METAIYKDQILTITDKLYRLARSILRNDVAAQDAVQDLNLKMWEKRKQLLEVDNVPAFAMRSMRNLCLDYLRQSHDGNEIPDNIEYEEMNPYQQTEQRDMVRRVQAMIERLPELQRSVIKMRDVEGMEISEIAYITQISENAVSVNLSRARLRIREQIVNEHKRVEQWQR